MKATPTKNGKVHHFVGLVTYSTKQHAKQSDHSHNGAILDSDAMTTMFKHPNEVADGFYHSGSRDTVELAAGSKPSNCLGTGTTLVKNLKLNGYIHANQLNDAFISVGRVFDLNKTMISLRMKQL